MKLHERKQITNSAKHQILHQIEYAEVEYNLTDTELLMIIRDIEQMYVDNYFKYQLRLERHGNMDTPAGLAVRKDNNSD